MEEQVPLDGEGSGATKALLSSYNATPARPTPARTPLPSRTPARGTYSYSSYVFANVFFQLITYCWKHKTL